MMLLKEIIRSHNLDLSGNTLLREAVRGVIVKENKLLMIYSAKEGDYKFPGGGVKASETYETALIREVSEECGAKVISIYDKIGKVIEYDRPMEQKYDVFKMISTYYLCEIDSSIGKQSLDQYEKDLGFTPMWIDIDEAISTNQKLIESEHYPRWTPRELHVLMFIKEAFNL